MLLALLVLVSSTSFMIGIHFCGGEIQNLAIFTKADSCEKERSLPPCHRHTKAPCCEDKTVIHKGDDFKSAAGHLHIEAPAPVDIDQPLVPLAEVIPSSLVSHIQDHNYDPPLRSGDITVEQQVFLI
jgi:hypothetical protein